MTHRILVGGFASGRSQMEKVASALTQHYGEDVDAISFREAMDNPARLGRMARRANVITHSAGMVTLEHTSPETITAVAPPVPVYAPLLAARAIASTTELALHSWIPGCEHDEVDGCIRDGTAELCMHFDGNIRWLGRIATFDALGFGRNAKKAGVETDLIFMRQDKLFQPTNANVQLTRRAGVPVTLVAGVHEDFIKSPRRILKLANK